MKNFFKKFILAFFIFVFILISYFFWGSPPRAKEISWGVNFSQKHSHHLGLDWRETYLALLDDLGIKNIKIITHWDLIEPEKDRYNFDDLDWQIEEAERRGAKIILVSGMKTGRWPECHIPEWAKNMAKELQQKEILELLEKVVLRYKWRFSVSFWQVENEPFFPFGECPWMSEDFLKKEINLVKSLDSRKILISDSGELSFWIRAAKLGDIVGTTLHRKVWFKELGLYLSYPFPPTYYWLRAQLVKYLYGKEVIVVELQAEPWGPKLLYDLPPEEQKKTMDLKQFKKNIEFARKTGFNIFYLWGAEWWHWMKEKQNQPEIWEEAKKLF